MEFLDRIESILREKSGKKELFLKDILPASTAAPGTFRPKEMEYGIIETKDKNVFALKKIHGAFVDGGVGSLNNPAVYIFLMTILRCFPFQWKMGADDIFLVSIGTAFSNFRKATKNILKKRWLWRFLPHR